MATTANTSRKMAVIPSNPTLTHCQRGYENSNVWCSLLVLGGTVYDPTGLGGGKNIPLVSLANYTLSSSTAGTQVVEVTYINSSYALAVEEVTLTGTTPKAMVNSAYCINGLKFKSGSNYTSTSQIINCYLTSDSTYIVARMDGAVHIVNGTFMCPDNYKAVLTGFFAAASTTAADFYCFVINSGRRYQAARFISILSPVNYQADSTVGLGVTLAAREMAVFAVSANPNAYIQATWSLQPV
jgi:hypothetical protein